MDDHSLSRALKLVVLVSAVVAGASAAWSAGSGAAAEQRANAPGQEALLRLPARLPTRQVRLPILMYHRINLSPPGRPSMERRLTVHPADFARQIDRKSTRLNSSHTVISYAVF